MKFSPELELYRVDKGVFASSPYQDCGAFLIPGPMGRMLTVIASSGDKELGVAWEHVSVSLPTRCPNWIEMCYVKDLFWDTEETVMQLHPPKSQWVNNHPNCLHLWRPLNAEIPMPPSFTVGDKSLGTLKKRT